jgi:hypothetical protein
MGIKSIAGFIETKKKYCDRHTRSETEKKQKRFPIKKKKDKNINKYPQTHNTILNGKPSFIIGFGDCAECFDLQCYDKVG